jgi:hypothetical protein
MPAENKPLLQVIPRFLSKSAENVWKLAVEGADQQPEVLLRRQGMQ